MGKFIQTEDPKGLSTIVDAIHDCWFDRDSIHIDTDTSVLQIRYVRDAVERRSIVKSLWFLKRIRIPVIECFLRVHHVKELSIDDKVKVGRYDFNQLLYEEGDRRVRITTGVPIVIDIHVNRLEISVEETDKIIEEKESTTLF